MSSLLRKRTTLAQSAPGKMWLGALVAVGLLSTVLCLAAAGTSAPAGTTALRTLAAHAAATPQQAARAGTPAAAAGTSTAVRPASTSPMAMTMATTKTVKIQSYAFSPSTLTINVGDTVTWTNYDTAPHTVTVSSGPVTFSSGNLAKGQSFTYTFTKAGTYSYYCAVHPDMVAKVVVTGSSTTPTPTPTPTPSPTPPMPMPSSSGCDGIEAAADAFLQHFYAAHLETSLAQQVSDALSVDQYTKTHTVLIENMLKPLTGGAQDALDAFLQHLYAAHLETSPGQQVSDALALDQYVKSHTVLIEHMIQPLIGGDTSSC